MTERNDIWPVIVRYLDNTMDSEDSERLEAWLDHNNENRRTLHAVSQIWKASEDKSQDALIDELNLEQDRSEEHTSELQSRGHLVCRLLLEKKNPETTQPLHTTTDGTADNQLERRNRLKQRPTEE